mmetsp:Transcript_1010/g.1819  ORF Transcript_1010/g.1819 Transcript_1010/m.1819 type:complete len:191 (-) Transcript_1010:16-588(-)
MQMNTKPWMRGVGSRQFNQQAQVSTDQLSLSKSQYYELLELLVFNILLPARGMAHTLKAIQFELPMRQSVREQFIERLTIIRNQIVADVKLTNHNLLQESTGATSLNDPAIAPAQPSATQDSKGGDMVDLGKRGSKLKQFRHRYYRVIRILAVACLLILIARVAKLIRDRKLTPIILGYITRSRLFKLLF